MIIKWIEIEGFKSFKNPVKFEFSDNNLIRGENGSGKTSIIESIVFTLFGQSLMGESRIDDIASGGNPKTEVITSVRFIDESVYSEYVVTRRKKESRYSITINGNPETQATIDAIVGKADVFLSAFNSAYFARTLDTTEKRALIETITEDLDYEDIFAAKSDLKLLDKYGFNLYSKDEHKRVDAKIKETQTKLTQMETEIEVLNNENLNSNIEVSIKEDRAREEELRNKLEQAQKFAMQRERLLERVMTSKVAKEAIKTLKKQMEELPKIDKVVSLEAIEKLDASRNARIDKSQNTIISLLSEIVDEEFIPQNIDPSHSECPTCLQKISEEHLDHANQIITKKREEVLARNKHLHESIKVEEQQIEKYKLEIGEKREALQSAFEQQKQILTQQNSLREQIRYQEEMVVFEPSEKEKKILSLDIEPLKQEYSKAVEENRSAAVINARVSEAEKKRENNMRRIDALNTSISVITDTLNELKSIYAAIHPSYLLKKAMEAKIEEISKHLNHASIELFREQKNGDLASVFEICYKSKGQIKPYRRLSNSETIKCGIEISNMINRLTGRRIPIFIDNTESISEIPMEDIDGQIFRAEVAAGEHLEVIDESLVATS